MAEAMDGAGAESGMTGPGGPGPADTGPANTGAADTGSAVAGANGSGGQFLPPREVMIILPGLLLAILLAMLDNLIVSTALPRIVGDLGGVAHLSWVVTAYILASLVVTPFYGKLGDMYGRKKFFVVAIVIFLAGSALSGLSQSMAELIMFRAVQGLGAGGLMVGAMATLGDIVSPRERGKYMSYMMVVMMLATIGGPAARRLHYRKLLALDLLHQPAGGRGGAGLHHLHPAPAREAGRPPARLPRRRPARRGRYLARPASHLGRN